MGAMSIWHWLILLLIVACFALPFIATATENSDQVADRKKFAIWFLCIFIGMPIVSTVHPAVAVILMLASPVLVFLYQRVLTRRCRDAGHSKIVAYIAAIPLLNLVVGLYLLFKSSARPAMPSPTVA
jgi:cytochrome b561